MADLKIRIGASVNADMGAVVFEPLVKAAQRARGQIRKAMDVGPEIAKDQNTAAAKATAFRMDLDKKAFAAHLQRSRDAAKQDAMARIAASSMYWSQVRSARLSSGLRQLTTKTRWPCSTVYRISELSGCRSMM